MRVFVLCTGRCGSTTFARACEHIEAYTVGHESRVHCVGEQAGERTDYPDDHIEVDNRLIYFIGRLYQRYGESPLYVHLRRDPEATAESFAHPKFFEGQGLMHAYRTGILRLQGHVRKEPMPSRKVLTRHYVNTVNSQIDTFLTDRRHTATVQLKCPDDFRRFLDRIGAEADKEAALARMELQAQPAS